MRLYPHVGPHGPRARVAAAAALLAALLAGCRATRPAEPRVSATAEPVPPDAPVVAMAEASAAPHTPPAAAGPLPFADAVARALALSTEAVVLREEIRVAESAARAARDRRDPELRLSYGREDEQEDRRRWSYSAWDLPATRPSAPGSGAASAPAGAAEAGGQTAVSDSETDSFTVGLRYFTENPWERAGRIAAARAAVDAARAEVRAFEWSLVSEVRRLYAEVHFLREDAGAQDEALALRKQVLDDTRALADQGLLTVRETAAAARRLLQAVSTAERTRRRLEEAVAELAALVGRPLAPEDVVTDDVAAGDPLAARPLPDTATLLRLALGARADVEALACRSREAEGACREAVGERRPWLTFVQATYASDSQSTDTRAGGNTSTYLAGRQLYDFDFTRDESDAEEWRLDTAINLPVFSWFNHAVELRRAEHRLAVVEEEHVRARVGEDLAAALAAVRRAEAARARYAAESAPVIRDLEAALRDSATSPVPLLPDDLGRMREELLEARRSLAAAQHAVRTATVALERALGMPLSALPAP